MTFVVDNFDEWETALLQELEHNRTDAEHAVHALGEDIGNRERRSAPRGFGPKHGADTIEVSDGRDGDEYFVDVGPDKTAFYLAFDEFGTEHQPPRPFMRPAVNEGVAAWRL